MVPRDGAASGPGWSQPGFGVVPNWGWAPTQLWGVLACVLGLSSVYVEGNIAWQWRMGSRGVVWHQGLPQPAGMRWGTGPRFAQYGGARGKRMPHGMLLHGEAWTYLQAITPAGRQGCQGRYGPLPARGMSLWGSPAWPHHILHPIPHGMLGTVRGGCHPCNVTVPGLSPSHTDAHRGRAAPKGGGTECPRAQQAPSLKGPRAEGAAQGAGVAGPWGPCSASAPHQGPPPAAGPRQGPCRGGGRGVSEAWHRDGHSYWGSRPLPASVVGCGAAAALPMPLPAPMGALGNLPCPGLLLAWVTHG